MTTETRTPFRVTLTLAHVIVGGILAFMLGFLVFASGYSIGQDNPKPVSHPSVMIDWWNAATATERGTACYRYDQDPATFSADFLRGSGYRANPFAGVTFEEVNAFFLQTCEGRP